MVALYKVKDGYEDYSGAAEQNKRIWGASVLAWACRRKRGGKLACWQEIHHVDTGPAFASA